MSRSPWTQQHKGQRCQQQTRRYQDVQGKRTGERAKAAIMRATLSIRRAKARHAGGQKRQCMQGRLGRQGTQTQDRHGREARQCRQGELDTAGQVQLAPLIRACNSVFLLMRNLSDHAERGRCGCHWNRVHQHQRARWRNKPQEVRGQTRDPPILHSRDAKHSQVCCAVLGSK